MRDHVWDLPSPFMHIPYKLSKRRLQTKDDTPCIDSPAYTLWFAKTSSTDFSQMSSKTAWTEQLVLVCPASHFNFLSGYFCVFSSYQRNLFSPTNNINRIMTFKTTVAWVIETASKHNCKWQYLYAWSDIWFGSQIRSFDTETSIPCSECLLSIILFKAIVI